MVQRELLFYATTEDYFQSSKNFFALGEEGLSLGFSGAAEDALGITSLCTKTWLEIYCCIHNFAYYCVTPGFYFPGLNFHKNFSTYKEKLSLQKLVLSQTSTSRFHLLWLEAFPSFSISTVKRKPTSNSSDGCGVLLEVTQ